MEYEIRYYYNQKDLLNILNKLRNVETLKESERSYEKTIQYDHPNKDMSFYNKEIDGRFRVRETKSETSSNCKLSWKRRLKDTRDDSVNKEEEVELNIKDEEYNNLLFIINNVLKLKEIESYERYRTIFYNNEIEIAVDEYPFGIALEIENKSNNINPKDNVEKWANILNLDITESYRLSWDDKYKELCINQNIKQYNHVSFGLPMPEVK